MDKKFISLPLSTFLFLCLVSISHSQKQSKTCPVEFASSGKCVGSFGISECYHESMARYGPIPPRGCQCIPTSVAVPSHICRCNVVCQQIHAAVAIAAAPPNAAAPSPKY